MNFKFAANLDASVGKALLSFVSLLPPYPKKIKTDTRFESILLMKFWGFGSILEATPFIRVLKQKYPDTPLDILTFSDNKQIVESLGLFRNVHVIDFRSGILNLLLQISRFVLAYRQKYSLVIDLNFFAYFSALVTKILSSRYSLGFRSPQVARNRCYSRTIIFYHSSHIRIAFLKFLDALYIKSCTEISLSAPIIPFAKRLSVMEKFPSLNKHIQIAININSSDLSINRRWPVENFRKLISFMQRDWNNLQIYLVGGERDLPQVRSFYETLPDKTAVFIAAAKFDILEFSYALSKMLCLITNDSGPLHIAEALGVPVVSFFGPETPNLYGPLLDKSLTFYKNLFCSPCLNVYNYKMSNCDDNRCLKLISPEEVYENIKTRYFNNDLCAALPS